MTSPRPLPSQTPPALRSVGSPPHLRQERRVNPRPPELVKPNADKVVTVQAGLASGTAHVSGEQATYVPAVPINASELQATSTAEFLDLLRELAKRSGANRKQLAERSGIPMSTTYYLLSPKTTTLPSKLEQVQALAHACGLTQNQVDRVTRLWVELRNPTAAIAAPVKPQDELDALVLGDPVDEEVEVADESNAVPLTMGGRLRRWSRTLLVESGAGMFVLLFAALVYGLLKVLQVTGVSATKLGPEVILATAVAAMAAKAWLNMTPRRVQVEVLRRYTRPDGTVEQVEHHTSRDGTVTRVYRTVRPDGTVDFDKHRPVKRKRRKY
jgi:hypothetical protein